MQQEKRRYGFHVSKKQRVEDEKAAKQVKWNQKLEGEDLAKLTMELKCLSNATFLAPHQKERKRLVERMVAALSAREAKATATATAGDDSIPLEPLEKRKRGRGILGEIGSSSDDEVSDDRGPEAQLGHVEVDDAWAQALLGHQLVTVDSGAAPSTRITEEVAQSVSSFVPRAVARKRPQTSAALGMPETAAKDAEKRLLQASTIGNDVDDFLDSFE